MNLLPSSPSSGQPAGGTVGFVLTCVFGALSLLFLVVSALRWKLCRCCFPMRGAYCCCKHGRVYRWSRFRWWMVLFFPFTTAWPRYVRVSRRRFIRHNVSGLEQEHRRLLEMKK